MDVNLIAGIFVAILGLCVGSFFNAVIWRLEQKKTLAGRSLCPHCKRQLRAKDLVPVASFIALGGKCRHCRKPISWQYPAIEIATALLFLLIFNVQFSNFNELSNISMLQLLALAFAWYITAALIAIFVYDAKHYLIPDKVLLPALVVTAAYRVIYFGIHFWVAALVFGGAFFAIFFVSQGRWLGFGDVKFALLMGLLLGFPATLLALSVASFAGALVGMGLIALSRKGWKSQIPFGPFLAAATLCMMLFGDQITHWYFNIL